MASIQVWHSEAVGYVADIVYYSAYSSFVNGA